MQGLFPSYTIRVIPDILVGRLCDDAASVDAVRIRYLDRVAIAGYGRHIPVESDPYGARPD